MGVSVTLRGLSLAMARQQHCGAISPALKTRDFCFLGSVFRPLVTIDSLIPEHYNGFVTWSSEQGTDGRIRHGKGRVIWFKRANSNALGSPGFYQGFFVFGVHLCVLPGECATEPVKLA